MNPRLLLLLAAWLLLTASTSAQQTRQRLLFNADWKFHKGDVTAAEKATFDNHEWRRVSGVSLE